MEIKLHRSGEGVEVSGRGCSVRIERDHVNQSIPGYVREVGLRIFMTDTQDEHAWLIRRNDMLGTSILLCPASLKADHYIQDWQEKHDREDVLLKLSDAKKVLAHRGDKGEILTNEERGLIIHALRILADGRDEMYSSEIGALLMKLASMDMITVYKDERYE